MTIAFAGAGAISSVHALAAKAIGLRITAVASRRAERAAARAEQMGAAAVPLAELPAGADVVVVCTPPGAHADLAVQALQGGAAVLVEVPLASTLADADRLVAAAADSGGRLGYAENVAHAPAVAGALARRHHLGVVTHLDGRIVQPAPPWGDARTGAHGGGVLLSTGSHLLGAALLLARPARPVRVSAHLEGGADHDVDEHASLTVSFDSGLHAQLVASWRTEGETVWDLQAAGRHGVVRVELSPTPALEVDGEAVPLPPARADLPDPRLEELGYCAQLTSFAAHVSARREPPPGPGVGRDVLDVVCGAYASAGDGGRPQPLPFAGPRHLEPRRLWRD